MILKKKLPQNRKIYTLTYSLIIFVNNLKNV